jgi:cytochrome c peroxidase
MKKELLLIFILFIFIVISISCKPSDQRALPTVQPVAEPGKNPDILSKEANNIFSTLPEKMPGEEKDTGELIKLGEKLYFDKRLSDNDTKSCNSCHPVDNKKGGADNLPTSPGSHGKNGKRNSPTVLNSGYQFAQFWDGRAAHLEEQAKGPILNTVEMSMAGDKEVVKKLSNIQEYKDSFKKAFPQDMEPLTWPHITMAIAAFERTLKTADRFDEFMNGKYDALSADEQKGLDKFISSGCINCHAGPLLGGNMYQKIGVVKPYKHLEDLGRYEVTKQDGDKYMFKVPILRNVALTGPYFHDGQIKTLEEAVKEMGSLQLGKELSDRDVIFIVKFLNSLSDKNRI